MKSAWDYIVIGGGTAGCVLAARLSENRAASVLLLEAGGGGKDRLPLISAPAGALYLAANKAFSWCDTMQPDPTCNNRVEMLNGGKLLGGGSAINGMMFIRGNPEDYDEWSQLGNAGWSYREVLPFFKKMERTSIGSDEYHGRDGPLGVEYAAPLLDVSHRFIDAAVESGIRYNSDVNGERQDGVSRTPCSISGGVRQSTALAYLRPAMSRPNLKVITGVHVRRIVFEKNVARGVEFRQRGADRIEMATHSIILSAGAVRSPQILMLSGVGPAEQLRKFDIPMVMNHPGVGLNHMEHPAAGVMYEVTLPTWNRELPIHRQIYHGVNWLLRKSGPAASGYCHAVAFMRTDSKFTRPDLQINLLPVGIVFDENKKRLDSSRNMVNVLVNSCRPLGRGRLELASANPVDPPLIFPRLLDGEATVNTMIKGIEIVRGIFNSPAMRPYVKREVTPGIGKRTRSDLTSWLRGATVDMSHPSGTCKMGQDGLAVVDERLRVRGVQNLRVADASIMPVIPSGNTNAPTIMIAEKAAQMILEDQ